MPDNRLPKQLLFGQLTHGVRPASGPKLRFKDIIKHNIKASGTTTNSWEQAAMERSKYCTFLHSGAMLAEATRAERVKEKRRRRKDCTSPEAGDPALTCPHCGRQFTAQIGLFAHLKWKHQQQWLPRTPRSSMCRLQVYRCVCVCVLSASNHSVFKDRFYLHSCTWVISACVYRLLVAVLVPYSSFMLAVLRYVSWTMWHVLCVQPLQYYSSPQYPNAALC